VLGLHHVSALASDLGRTTDLYVDTLGLRLVKQTINYDDPSVWHLYYGNAAGTPGTVVTYFGYPQLRQARPGAGVYHHIALAVEDGQLEAWRDRLQTAKLEVSDIQQDAGFQTFEFRDPDGHRLKLATRVTV
jgi:glyoxalase family protein